jgi:hypothetical protein
MQRRNVFTFGHDFRIRPITNFRLPGLAKCGIHKGFTLAGIPFGFAPVFDDLYPGSEWTICCPDMKGDAIRRINFSTG